MEELFIKWNRIHDRIRNRGVGGDLTTESLSFNDGYSCFKELFMIVMLCSTSDGGEY